MMNEEDIPNYVFDEVLALNELEWRFLSKGTSGGYVQSLVKSVSDYASISPTLVVAGPRRLALRDTNSRLLASNSPRTSFASDVQRSEARSATIKLATKFCSPKIPSQINLSLACSASSIAKKITPFSLSKFLALTNLL